VSSDVEACVRDDPAPSYKDELASEVDDDVTDETGNILTGAGGSLTVRARSRCRILSLYARFSSRSLVTDITS
jgi:hypothetical protein